MADRPTSNASTVRSLVLGTGRAARSSAPWPVEGQRRRLPLRGYHVTHSGPGTPTD